MSVLPRLKCLTCTCLLVIIYFQKSASDECVLGRSSCSYIGMVAIDCGMEAVALDDLPKSCSSFIYDGASIDNEHTIHTNRMDPYSEYFNKLGQFGSSVVVNLGHNGYNEWAKIMDCDGQNATKEAVGIKAFTSQLPAIKGILLRQIEPEPDSNEIEDFNQKLLKYIDVVKQETSLQIGLAFMSDLFYLKVNEKQGVPWLNFTALDPYVEFYVFTLFSFTNECTEGTRNGITPINGNEEYTLEKLALSIQNSNIPNKKVYYFFPLTPVASDGDTTFCSVTYQQMCESPKTSKNWCANTQQTFFEKGKWVHQNGAGFVGAFVDFDDPQNACNCGKYPSFNAILAGFNGTASVPACPMYDRLC